MLPTGGGRPLAPFVPGRTGPPISMRGSYAPPLPASVNLCSPFLLRRKKKKEREKEKEEKRRDLILKRNSHSKQNPFREIRRKKEEKREGEKKERNPSRLSI